MPNLETINVGASPDDRTGDTWRDTMIKANNNFSSLNAQSYVYINDESDLPNVSAGASTLEADTRYIFKDGLSISTRLIFSTGTSVHGTSTFSSSGLTYTGTGNFITGNLVDGEIKHIRISAPNANQIISWTGNTLDNYSLIVDNCVLTNTPKLGTFNTAIPLFTRFVCTNFDDGFTLAGGPIIGGSFTEGLMQDRIGTAVHIDVSNSLLLTFKVIEIVFAGSGTVLSSSIGGANGLNEIQVSQCDFGVIAGSMTPLAGFVDGFQTNGWIFSLNGPPQDVQPTRFLSEAYLTTANTITVAAISTFYEIGIPASGAWAADILDHFTVGTDGVLTYTGTRDIEVGITITASVEKVGGGSDEIEMRSAINWVAAATGIQKSRVITQNVSPTSLTSRAIILLSPNDDVRPIFSNNTGTANIIVNTIRYDIMGE